MDRPDRPDVDARDRERDQPTCARWRPLRPAVWSHPLEQPGHVRCLRYRYRRRHRRRRRRVGRPRPMTTSIPSYRRRVGSVRPSHLMFTAGVGALVDLPNFAVLIRGLDDWQYNSVQWEPLAEPRLLEAVRRTTHNPQISQLRPAPWIEGLDGDPNGPAARVGVPTVPFPGWLRCTACNTLSALDTQWFTFENTQPRRPDLARFFHASCPSKRKKPLAVTARFLL